MIKIRSINILFGLTLIISSCQNLYATPPLEYVEPRVCGYSLTAKTWIDSNKNGVWDTAEQSLPNITIILDDVAKNHMIVSWGVSDRDGNTFLGVYKEWIEVNCPILKYDIYPETPQNCQLTTPERLSISFVAEEDEIYSFGFVCE